MNKFINIVSKIVIWVLVSFLIAFFVREVIISSAQVEIVYETSKDSNIRIYYDSGTINEYPFTDEASVVMPIDATQGSVGNTKINVPLKRMKNFRIDFLEIDEFKLYEVNISISNINFIRLGSVDLQEKLVGTYGTLVENKDNYLYIGIQEPRGIIELGGIDTIKSMCVINTISMIIGCCISLILIKIFGVPRINLGEQRVKQYIFLIIFMMILVGPNILVKFGVLGESISSENRKLKEKPILNINTLRTYPNEFEAYYTDNVPFKNKIVKLNNIFKYKVLGISPAKYVIKGEKDWLFYDSKYKNDGDTIADYQGLNYYSDEELVTIKNALLEKRDYLVNQGIDFALMIGPNKSQIYSEFMPDYYTKINKDSRIDQLVDYLSNNTDLNIIYPKDELLKLKNEYPLYYKLDTHWNDLGGYVGVRELMNQIRGNNELQPLEELSVAYEAEDISFGDLVSMLNLNNVLGEKKYYIKNYRDDISVEFVESINPNTLKYKSSNLNGEKILMFRDSFATAMIPYLYKEFEESVFIWDHYFNKEVIEEEKPDIVVWEIVERNRNSLLSY